LGCWGFRFRFRVSGLKFRGAWLTSPRLNDAVSTPLHSRRVDRILSPAITTLRLQSFSRVFSAPVYQSRTLAPTNHSLDENVGSFDRNCQDAITLDFWQNCRTPTEFALHLIFSEKITDRIRRAPPGLISGTQIPTEDRVRVFS